MKDDRGAWAMKESQYVDSLVDEYTTLFRGRFSNTHRGQQDATGIAQDLAVSADWSVQGARELVRLANEYGAFMLRNALAIAVALGKEDGTLGY